MIATQEPPMATTDVDHGLDWSQRRGQLPFVGYCACGRWESISSTLDGLFAAHDAHLEDVEQRPTST